MKPEAPTCTPTRSMSTDALLQADRAEPSSERAEDRAVPPPGAITMRPRPVKNKAVLLRDGTERPFPGTVTRSSADTPWPGFPIESRKLSGQGSLADFELPAGCLALCVRGRSQCTLEAGKDTQSFE